MKRMRLLFSTFFFLHFLTFNFAQSNTIRQLESEFSKAKQADYVAKALQLSQAFFDEGFFIDAQQKADNALTTAQQLKLTEQSAVAMHHKAQAMIEAELKTNKPKLFLGAKDLLESSLKLLKQTGSTNETVIKSSLNYLKLVLEKRGNKKEMGVVQQQLDVLNTKDQNRQIQAENQNLTQNVSHLNEKTAQLNQQTQQLNGDLQQREQVIGALSEAQAKAQLLIANQRITLDSVGHQHQLDTLALNEARIENDLQRSQRNLFLALAALVFILGLSAAGAFWRQKRTNKVLAEKNKIIEHERERAESLLLNILPASIAQELKLHNFARSRRLEKVTVLFTDFVNFTHISEQSSPEDLVADLDFCFRQMDAIIMQYGLEKIKTIGDAYMCAGGVPEPSGDNIHQRVVQAALDIQKFLDEWKITRLAEGKSVFEARLGIHTGAVVAGVVGTKKFAYDIWGDTVNIAARMQSSGEKGRVNVSGDTYQLIKHQFNCSFRGKVSAKNKGEIEMYFVDN
jgi:adenylate cyclase